MPHGNYLLFLSEFMGPFHFGLDLAATFQAHHRLGKLHPSIPSHLRLIQKLPPNSLRPKLAGFSLTHQILCTSALHCPRGAWNPTAGLSIFTGGAFWLCRGIGRGGAAPWDALSSRSSRAEATNQLEGPHSQRSRVQRAPG